jgi:dCTP deaminase
LTLLSHEDLKNAMVRDLDTRLVITPLLDEDQIGPASVDLRLGTEFLVMRRTRGAGLDPVKDPEGASSALHDEVRVPLGQSLWLHPQHFILGSTLEFIRLPPDLGAYVLGRSSWGRVGLLVATAVMVQPGYGGALTLELVNEGDAPVRLYPGLRVAQLAVHALNAPTKHVYARPGAKYLAPTGPQTSRAAWDKEEIDKLQAVGERLLSTS